jgi:serine/threonine protein kinase
MLGKLKAMFRSKGPASPGRRNVNIERRFTLITACSQGSMSRVFRATDNETGRTVCLKVQFRGKNEAAAARAGKAFRPSEGEIASKLHHPNVVKTFEFGTTNRGEHYLVMEFIDGPSLNYLRESKALDDVRKIDLLLQAAEGVKAVHDAGFLHHDLAPKNILVDREGRAKLIDFGLAVPDTAAFRGPGNRTGTLQYMAPELIRREPIDERMDIFAFGAIAFEVLTDRLPYEGGDSLNQMLRRMNAEPMDPAQACPRITPELRAFLMRALARRREERYASMAELIEDLARLQGQGRLFRAEGRCGPSSKSSLIVASPSPNDVGGIYLLKSGKYYRIGKTSNFERRLTKIQATAPQPIEVVHTIPAADHAEAQAIWLRRFAPKRRGGDWFALSESDVEEFKSCMIM